MAVSDVLALTVPVLLAGVGLYGALTGTDVFSALTAGALDGLKTVVWRISWTISHTFCETIAGWVFSKRSCSSFGTSIFFLFLKDFVVVLRLIV